MRGITSITVARAAESVRRPGAPEGPFEHARDGTSSAAERRPALRRTQTALALREAPSRATLPICQSSDFSPAARPNPKIMSIRRRELPAGGAAATPDPYGLREPRPTARNERAGAPIALRHAMGHGDGWSERGTRCLLQSNGSRAVRRDRTRRIAPWRRICFRIKVRSARRGLTRIIHERFCCNRGFAAATCLPRFAWRRQACRRTCSPLSPSTYCFKYASVLHGCACPSRHATPRFRDEPS
jgi:hypothetical protein